jgi:hypothetical protein
MEGDIVNLQAMTRGALPCYGVIITNSMTILRNALLCLLLSSCVARPSLQISESSNLAEIKVLDKCNFNFQCKKIHTGFNPCGAHTGYLLYSTLIGGENIANLKLAVAKNRADEEAEYWARNGDLYECQPAFTLWPNPVCSNNVCVIK